MRAVIRITLASDQRIHVRGETSDAEQAIHLCRMVGPGLIILDNKLRGDRSGLEVAPELKKVAPEAKILMFSAYDLREEAAREPAIDAFLLKTDIGRLLSTTQRLLGLAES